MIAALNTLGSQPLALLLILIGGGFILAFKHFGVDIKPAEDIIVAGITLLTAQAIGSRTADHPTQPADPAQPQK